MDDRFTESAMSCDGVDNPSSVAAEREEIEIGQTGFFDMRGMIPTRLRRRMPRRFVTERSP